MKINSRITRFGITYIILFLILVGIVIALVPSPYTIRVIGSTTMNRRIHDVIINNPGTYISNPFIKDSNKIDSGAILFKCNDGINIPVYQSSIDSIMKYASDIAVTSNFMVTNLANNLDLPNGLVPDYYELLAVIDSHKDLMKDPWFDKVVSSTDSNIYHIRSSLTSLARKSKLIRHIDTIHSMKSKRTEFLYVEGYSSIEQVQADSLILLGADLNGVGLSLDSIQVVYELGLQKASNYARHAEKTSQIRNSKRSVMLATANLIESLNSYEQGCVYRATVAGNLSMVNPIEPIVSLKEPEHILSVIQVAEDSTITVNVKLTSLERNQIEVGYSVKIVFNHPRKRDEYVMHGTVIAISLLPSSNEFTVSVGVNNSEFTAKGQFNLNDFDRQAPIVIISGRNTLLLSRIIASIKEFQN